MDSQMVELILERNEEGIKLLQSKYGGLLQYIVGNILIDSRDTEECISDIYMIIWNKIESFDDVKGKFPTWLTVIARNTAINYKKRKNTPCDELSEELAAGSTPEESLLKREQTNRLMNKINSLSIKEQHLFYRKYYYLQSTAQIGAELGMTERSVEGKLYRLRKKLQRLLGGDILEQ